MQIMITGNENLLQLSEISDELIPFFEKHGLGNFFNPENLNKIGRFTRLNSLLKSKNMDGSQFINSLNQIVNSYSTDSVSELKDIQHNLHFAAMLPCGLRNPFKEYVENYILNNPEKFTALNYLIEGNVNHELSYYPLLDSIKDENELPDIIMASDVNNFFHRPFIDRFIKSGIFETYKPYEPNEYLEKTGYSDPKGNYTMFTSNMLIMVVDKNKLGNRTLPKTWDDILSPAFKNDIIMRGEDDFFCNAVLLPFYKDHGMDVMKTLARNIKSGMHPANMVKLAGKKSDEGATVYIMPYFFAKRITSPHTEIIWPEDGAIVSPVFLLVKKDKVTQHKELLDFMFSKKTGKLLVERYFPSIHPEVNHGIFKPEAKWLGWDFLSRYDIGDLKAKMRDEFMKVWNTKTTTV